MHLTQREQEKLLIYVAAHLARARQVHGLNALTEGGVETTDRDAALARATERGFPTDGGDQNGGSG